MKTKNILMLALATLTLLAGCGKKYSQTKPEIKDITETVFASGVLVPENQYYLTAQTEGYLIEVNFKEGDIVEKNELLAVIDNQTSVANLTGSNQLLHIAKTNLSPDAPTFKQLEININAAKEKMLQDSLQYQRYKQLYASKSVSKLEFETIGLTYENSNANYLALLENFRLQKQLAEQQYVTQKIQSDVNNVSAGNNKLRAIIEGKVYKKLKQLGDYVKRGDVIAIIGSPVNLYAELSIDEANISKIKLNQPTLIQLNTDKTKIYNAIISEIYPSFNIETQSFLCKATFTDSLDFLISGTQIQANIIIAQKKDVLVIPRKYLDFGNTVMLKNGDKISIETGFISNDWVEIINGLDTNTVIKAEK